MNCDLQNCIKIWLYTSTKAFRKFQSSKQNTLCERDWHLKKVRFQFKSWIHFRGIWFHEIKLTFLLFVYLSTLTAKKSPFFCQYILHYKWTDTMSICQVHKLSNEWLPKNPPFVKNYDWFIHADVIQLCMIWLSL